MVAQPCSYQTVLLVEHYERSNVYDHIAPVPYKHCRHRHGFLHSNISCNTGQTRI